MTLAINYLGKGSLKPSKHYGIWTLIALSVACFSFSCHQPTSLDPPESPLPELKLQMGELKALKSAPNQDYSPMNTAGAILQENISSVLEAEGIPPVRYTLNAKGKWSKGGESPTFKTLELQVSPENPKLAAKIEKELSKGTPVDTLPLGPLSLFKHAPEAPDATRSFPLEKSALGEKVQASGTWTCRQGFGASTYGASRWIRCTLEKGNLSQPENNETRIRERKAQLLGEFSAFRASKDPKHPRVSTEEIRVHLSAWSESPRPTLIELKYHRTACLDPSNCPISSR
tara:strand:- start:111 stop:971 length:861 start_codon:yes stop_codon:yes gene_type:complete